MLLASETPAIAAIITAFVAVVGLAVTAGFNQLNRRDADRERDSLALHDASKRLASDNASERAVGMAAVLGSRARNRFAAAWWNGSGKVEAEVVAQDSAFERKRSTDGHDGVYKIDLIESLDDQRHVVLRGNDPSRRRDDDPNKARS
jgi:hypothetical protein